jgi:septal ring factor EnvC (AmiA/AmiB activator)
VADLEAKVQQKSELFAKDLDQARGKHAGERSSLQKECDELREKLGALEDEKAQASWRLEKDILLLNERIKYLEYQKDQVQKEREDSEKRLQTALEQIKKSNEKLTEDSENKRSQNDRRYVAQLEALRESMRAKEGDFEEILRRQKEETKTLRDKNQELQERLQTQEKQRVGDKSYQ